MDRESTMAMWSEVVKSVESQIASMSTDQDAMEALTVGLPILLTTVEQGLYQEIKQDSKLLVIKMVDALGKNGYKLKAGSDVEALYLEFKKELELCPTDNHVYTPLPSIFENVTLSQILNAPFAPNLPKHGYLGN